MAKRILTKEKLDKQLTGQTSTSPFMNIRDETERKVSCNATDELGDEIDNLTAMMGRTVMTKDHLIPKYTKVEVLTLKVRTEPTIKENIKIGVD